MMARACAAGPLKSVAILGAGPSGLAACKAALEEGLDPVVFEKAPGVGGLWRQDDHGKVWRKLRTNLSKYTCAFSDAPWPKEASDFPSGSEVQDYLQRFAESEGLLPYIRFGTAVTSLKQWNRTDSTELRQSQGQEQSSSSMNSLWRVSWQAAFPGGDSSGCSTFAHVIIATGIFAEPRMPDLPGLDKFPGQVLHTGSYKAPSQLTGKRVLVVGAAFSGADIAADVAPEAKSVKIAARRPIWYLPRYIGGKPADLVFYSRAGSEKNQGKSEEERNLAKHGFFRTLLDDAGGAPDGLSVPQAGVDIPFVAITDQFLPAVRAGAIQASALGVMGFEGSSALMSDGSRLEVDAVVVATGYQPNLSFMPPDILSKLEYDPHDWLQPMILHETMWRPELPGLAFAGLYRGPYFAVMELQARWACGVFSGRLAPPEAAEAAAGLEAERSIRSQRPRPQFPHGDYVGMAEALAKKAGVHPTAILSNSSHPLWHHLHEGPLLPFHYRLEGFRAKAELATSAILACGEAYPAA